MSDPESLDVAGGPCPRTIDECVPYPLLAGFGFRAERGSECERVARELDAARAAEKDAAERVKLCKAQLVHLSGGAERIVLADGSGLVRRVEDRPYAAQPARVITREVLERVTDFPPPQRR